MPEEEKIMSFNKNKVGAAAVLAVTILIVGSVVGYGLHRAGTVGKPFSDDGRIKVMASFYPMYDFAQKVGGDKVEVKDMVPAGTEPHDWEPAATDIRNLEDADVLFITVQIWSTGLRMCWPRWRIRI